MLRCLSDNFNLDEQNTFALMEMLRTYDETQRGGMSLCPPNLGNRGMLMLWSRLKLEKEQN